MPINALYQFDTNKYVYSTLLTESRGGSEKHEKPVLYTEVYEITNDGYRRLVASGKLVPNKDIPDYNLGFAIVDPDKKETIDFKISMYLTEMKINDFDELCDAVARNHKKNR